MVPVAFYVPHWQVHLQFYLGGAPPSRPNSPRKLNFLDLALYPDSQQNLMGSVLTHPLTKVRGNQFN